MASSGSGSGESKDFEDFCNEVQEIEKSKDPADSGDDDSSKTPDEGEQEIEWLKEAGYPHLATKLEEGKELKEDVLNREMSSLTRAQAAAVKKRVDTLNATIRKKHQKQKKPQKGDVRDIFTPQQDDEKLPDDLTAPAQGTEGGKPNRITSFKGISNRGGYAMQGGNNLVDDTGVETISIQKGKVKGEPSKPPPTQGSSLAVSEVALSFAVEGSRISPVPQRQPVPGARPAEKSGLPNFVLVKDVLGITRVDDLGKNDISKIRALALIELSALFDTNNITYTRRKHRKRLKEHGIFGVPLQTLLEHDQRKWPHLSLKVPRILLELVRFLEKTGLEEEGILRVAGSVSRIKMLREEIENNFNSGKFSWDEVWCNDAAGLLKQFIRELPAPLLTFEYIEAFAQVDYISSSMHQLQALNLLVLLLPDVHRNTLKLLLEFLKKVVDHKENKMTENNVAMIMAPNLFLVKSNSNKSKATIQQLQFHMATGTATIVKMLLKYQDILWTVPSFMMIQIRHQYEAEMLRKARDKSNSKKGVYSKIMKFWGKKDKSDAYKKPATQQENDYQEGVIRVQVPHLTKYHTAVQLNAATTAGDVIEKFQRRSFVSMSATEHKNNKHEKRHDKIDQGIPVDAVFSVDNMVLRESGGNIGERNLDNSTNMLALLRVNPNAEWIIRPQPD